MTVNPIYVQMCHNYRMRGSYAASPYCAIITPNCPSEAPQSPSQLTHVCYDNVATSDYHLIKEGSVRVVFRCTCVQKTHCGSARNPAFTALLFCKVRMWPRVFLSWMKMCLCAQEIKRTTAKSKIGRMEFWSQQLKLAFELKHFKNSQSFLMITPS